MRLEPRRLQPTARKIDVNSRPPKLRPESPAPHNPSIRQNRVGALGAVSFSGPPQSSSLTDYDRQHLALYLRLLDSAAEGADWAEVARTLFGLDPDKDAAHARAVHDSHLARARWMAEHGYRDLFEIGAALS
jgi:hypothetical protein